jgi:hypothetical protein
MSMFAAVTVLVGGAIYFERMAHTDDARAIIRIHAAIAPFEKLGIGLFVLAILFGLATALTGQLDLTAPWLLIAYVLTASLFVLGPLEGARYARIVKVAERVAAATDEASTGGVMASGEAVAELHQATHDPTLRAMTAASIVIYLVIIFDMVNKPFS